MPWILLPFIFLFSIQINFINSNISDLFYEEFLIPIALYLGLKYREKGVLVLGIGVVTLFLPYDIQGVNFLEKELFLKEYIEYIYFRHNSGLYILIITLSSIASYYSELFKTHHSNLYI